MTVVWVLLVAGIVLLAVLGLSVASRAGRLAREREALRRDVEPRTVALRALVRAAHEDGSNEGSRPSKRGRRRPSREIRRVQ